MQLLDLPMHRRLFETERDRQLVFWATMALGSTSFPDYAYLHKRIRSLFQIDEEALKHELTTYLNQQAPRV